MNLPESPRWLMFKGKEDEARSVLAALSGLGEEDVRSRFTLRIPDLRLTGTLGIYCGRVSGNQGYRARNPERKLWRSIYHG